ncbi:MAG: GNAT family N-acetyltransferase [Dehalococcoidales bacterium]|nr:GNAT family N-acetyltransferase [Dehalococcoidales bacterium]
MSVRIIKAKKEHLTAMGQLWWEMMLFHRDVDAFFNPRDGSIPGFEENMVRRLMKSKEGLALVALDGEKVVGYLLAEIQGPGVAFDRERWVYIDDTAVTQEYRRRGLGAKLYARTLKWTQKKGLKRIQLSTADANKTSNAFWQKQGFQPYMHILAQDI